MIVIFSMHCSLCLKLFPFQGKEINRKFTFICAFLCLVCVCLLSVSCAKYKEGIINAFLCMAEWTEDWHVLLSHTVCKLQQENNFKIPMSVSVVHDFSVCMRHA